MSSALMSTYAPGTVRFTRGEGVWLWDDQGERYLDALCGLAVTALGHAHPDVAAAVSDQASRLVHTSNLYAIGRQEELAQRLTGLAGMDRVFFCNSGAEANEAAIKLARAYGHQRDIEAPTVIAVEGSFHGRTMASLSATGNDKVHRGFTPLLPGFVHVPYDDIDAVAAAADATDGVVAVLCEPILGEGGVVVPAPGYLRRLRALCDERGWLLMLDEVQTGMGRTGRWFAFQHEEILPDVMTLAKALGNGVPIGACLARGAAAEVLQPGSHGSTFGGNPLSCAAALAVIDTIERDGLVEAAAERGQALMKALASALEGQNCVAEIRGKGMMIGIVLDRACPELVKMAMARGVLLNVTADRVVRLLPPYIMEQTEIDQLAGTVGAIVREWNAGHE